MMTALLLTSMVYAETSRRVHRRFEMPSRSALVDMEFVENVEARQITAFEVTYHDFRVHLTTKQHLTSADYADGVFQLRLTSPEAFGIRQIEYRPDEYVLVEDRYERLRLDLNSSAVPWIWRWQRSLASDYGRLHLSVTVFDPEGSPVLAEFSATSAEAPTLDITHVTQFRVVGKGQFLLDFAAGPIRRIVVYPDDRFVVYPGDGTWSTQAEPMRRERFDQFRGLDDPANPRLVLEPLVGRPVAYETYFAPKGLTTSGPGVADPPRPVRASARSERLNGRGADLDRLLNQTDKPTIAEFLAFLGDPPKSDERNPFGNAALIKAPILDSVPDLIARFEAAFPNGRYFGLGRDIYLLNDVLDAYYTARGEAGRVIRLPASHPSFQNASPGMVWDFMRGFGFDLRSERPQIIFDTTSYSLHSQSRFLMQAAYRAWIKQKRAPNDLLRRINFISTHVGRDHDTLIDAGTGAELERYFTTTRADQDGPERILHVRASRMLQYSRAWHGLYQPMRRHLGRTVTSSPGVAFSAAERRHLLAELWVVVQTATTDEFHAAVERARRRFACAGALEK